ncbi:MAG: transmembrane 220 family protein [Bacteroidia bacterium]|nr:transmembrane 220 family protein [Bacteroidia bacterium]
MLAIICALLCMMFVYFAYLNFNDVDPALWVTIYLIAALFCALAVFKITNLYAAIILSIGYVGFAIKNWPVRWEGVTMPMSHSINVERGRESLGLLICAAAVWFCYYAAQ